MHGSEEAGGPDELPVARPEGRWVQAVKYEQAPPGAAERLPSGPEQEQRGGGDALPVL